LSHLRPIDEWFMDQVLPLEPMLLASARRLVDDREAARDLVQGAFLRILTVDGWAQIDAPHAYLLRMMRNLAFEKLRRARIARFDQLAMAEDFDIVDESPDAFRVVSGREQVARLDAVLKGLPERCRRVFVMRRIEERSPREIAQALGLSPSTLEKRLARAHYLIAQAFAASPAKMANAGKTADAPGREKKRGALT
jgi:RNA polymerase sigma factor (sigma-70 family)